MTARGVLVFTSVHQNFVANISGNTSVRKENITEEGLILLGNTTRGIIVKKLFGPGDRFLQECCRLFTLLRQWCEARCAGPAAGSNRADRDLQRRGAQAHGGLFIVLRAAPLRSLAVFA